MGHRCSRTRPAAGVSAIGVDETAFLRATGKHPTLYVTGVADLTPGRPARLLNVVPGRSGRVLGGWLADRDQAWRAGIVTASLDPFRGYAVRHEALVIRVGCKDPPLVHRPGFSGDSRLWRALLSCQGFQRSDCARIRRVGCARSRRAAPTRRGRHVRSGV